MIKAARARTMCICVSAVQQSSSPALRAQPRRTGTAQQDEPEAITLSVTPIGAMPPSPADRLGRHRHNTVMHRTLPCSFMERAQPPCVGCWSGQAK